MNDWTPSCTISAHMVWRMRRDALPGELVRCSIWCWPQEALGGLMVLLTPRLDVPIVEDERVGLGAVQRLPQCGSGGPHRAEMIAVHPQYRPALEANLRAQGHYPVGAVRAERKRAENVLKSVR